MEAYPGREGQLDLVLWSERIRAVIVGDTLIDLGNGLEIPASWLPEGVTVEQVKAGLRPLLDKPVEFVLPTHGEPAYRAALERALAGSVRGCGRGLRAGVMVLHGSTRRRPDSRTLVQRGGR
jgi:glyoxylase-like metal-dependent hydrolase (beta-lactamase superfamily II)